jgi:hypothetical protein
VTSFHERVDYPGGRLYGIEHGPHKTWSKYQAEQLVREADHAIFIGSRLPEYDVDVVYLLKRGLV